MNKYKKTTENLQKIPSYSYPIIFCVIVTVMFSIVGVPFLQGWRALPSEMPPIAVGHSNIVQASDGSIIAETWTEDRTELESLDKISSYAINALIATEDNRFYHNNGVDLQGTFRAALTGSGGGSGITQQLVKNLQYYNLVENTKEEATENSINRKIKELKLSLNYEKENSKDEILLSYFNLVAFGSPNTYSIENAAQKFFHKPARELNIEESAVLIGSVQNPSVFNIASNDEGTIQKVKNRQYDVLNRMFEEGYITEQERDAAAAAPLNIDKNSDSIGTCRNSEYQFYCQYVFDYIRSSPRYGENPEEREALITKGGLVIKTHLDKELTSITDEQLSKDYGSTNRIAVPVAIVNNNNGGVSVMTSNRKYGTNQEAGETEIDLSRNPSGTGSVFKLMTLAAALNEGYTRNDLAFSSQCPLYPGSGYEAPPGGFKNSNSCDLQGGFLDYKKATAYSSNTWYVTLEMKIGVEKVKEFASSVGLAPKENIGSSSLSYTLGSTEHSAVDVAAAYATFANGGVYCPPTPVDNITYKDKEIPIPDTYDESKDKCHSVMSPQSASIVLEAMRANISGELPGAFGTQFAIPGYDSAGKSGTNELQNSTWVQLIGNYTLFANMYDPELASRGIATTYYRGRAASWSEHVIGYTGRDILSGVISTRGYEPLDYNSTETSFKPALINQKDMFTVPYVIGMKAEEALTAFEKRGIKAHVDREKDTESPWFYQEGIVTKQSLEPGTRISVGTNKEVILTIK